MASSDKQTLKRFLAQLAIILSLPLIVFAARTATPTVSSLFPTNLLYVNFAPPVISLPNARATGSIGAGSTLAFAVTALDGLGESIPGNAVATTSVQSSGLQLTWPAVTGATGYRIYFSTSTTQSFVQYFTATSTSGTPNAYYTLTSTSTPTFIPTGLPTSNTAYGVKFNSTGTSYILGGSFGIGTSSPTGMFSVTGCLTNTPCAYIASVQGQNAELWIGQGGQAIDKQKAQDNQFRNTYNSLYFFDAGDAGALTLAMNQTNQVGVATSSMGAQMDVYTPTASTSNLLLESSSKGGCAVVKDVQGTGYTQITTNAGVISGKVHTGALNTCN